MSKIEMPDPPIGYLMARTHLTLKKQLNKAISDAGHDVTVEQMGLMRFLWQQDGVSQRALVNQVKKVKSSITRLIDNMEKRNLVVRVPDQNDKRNKLIYLTHKGKALQKELGVVLDKKLEQAYQNIEKEHIQICKNVLISMFCNLDNIE
jgi:DNA-binding MarR family transcriptional regulator